MAEEKKLSVAEILAAARKMDGGGDGGSDDSGTAAAADSPVAADAPAEVTSEPTTAAPSAAASAGKPGSVAEMIAMARAETQGGSKPKESPAKAAPSAAKPKAPAAKKTAAKSKAAEKSGPAERMDTASVLAAARGDTKRGPVSKAEAPELMQRKRPAPVAAPKPALPEMPQRPASVSKTAKAAKAGQKEKVEERRQFVFLSALFGSSFATGMTLLSTTAVVWTLALARYLFPNVLTEPPSQFKVGFPEDFAPGQVETKFKAQFGIWLVSADYQGEPCIFALSTVCTHLGCTPNWLDSEQKFKCPCHGSGFYKDGINFEGPAPRPLERYAIRVASDGQLEVDKSRKFQEEMGQWQDPASFVSV